MIIKQRIPIHFMEDEVGSLVLIGVKDHHTIDAHFKMSASSPQILQHVNEVWEFIVLSLKELGITEVYTCVPCDLLDEKMIKFWGWMGFDNLKETHDHFYASRRL